MTKPARDWAKDWEICERATPGPWKHEDRFYIRVPGVLQSLAVLNWDEERNGRFIAEAREALPYWLQRVKELEEVLRLAYRALTEGMADVPAEARDPQCARMRLEAKKAIRKVLRG